MSSKRKPNPQRWQAAAWSSRPSRPSLSIDRFWQFGQMKYGTWRSGLDARRGERVVQVSLFGRQEALGVERAHAAGPGRGDGLAVRVILDVADREHAGDVRLRRARLRDQITGVVVLELVQEQRRVRVVADRDEQSVGRDDHRASLVLVVADPDAEGTLGEVDLGHVVGDELRPELLGLPAELHHHLRAEDPLGVSGVVLDVARDHELAAPLEALDHEGLQVGTGGIERRRVPGGPAADDDQVTDFHLQYSTVPTGWVFHGPGDYNRAAPGRPLSWPSS